MNWNALYFSIALIAVVLCLSYFITKYVMSEGEAKLFWKRAKGGKVAPKPELKIWLCVQTFTVVGNDGTSEYYPCTCVLYNETMEMAIKGFKIYVSTFIKRDCEASELICKEIQSVAEYKKSLLEKRNMNGASPLEFNYN